jgi:hypothetical protein
MFDELEIFIPGQVPDVGCVAGDQIIDGNNPVTFLQQSIAQMRSQKTGGAGYNRNWLRSFLCHSALYLRAGTQICQSEVSLMTKHDRRIIKETRMLQ